MLVDPPGLRAVYGLVVPRLRRHLCTPLRLAGEERADLVVAPPVGVRVDGERLKVERHQCGVVALEEAVAILEAVHRQRMVQRGPERVRHPARADVVGPQLPGRDYVLLDVQAGGADLPWTVGALKT